MKMFLIAIFGLLCLGPYAAMGKDYSWIPDQVPRPSQQCIDLGLGYAGACAKLARNNILLRGHYKIGNVCSGLNCAERRETDRGYNSVIHGRPLDGTLCGVSKACHHGNCVTIPSSRIPTATGAETTYNCEPESIQPNVLKKND